MINPRSASSLVVILPVFCSRTNWNLLCAYKQLLFCCGVLQLPKYKSLDNNAKSCGWRLQKQAQDYKFFGVCGAVLWSTSCGFDKSVWRIYCGDTPQGSEVDDNLKVTLLSRDGSKNKVSTNLMTIGTLSHKPTDACIKLFRGLGWIIQRRQGI